MAIIVFDIAWNRSVRGQRLGVAPSFQGAIPLPSAAFTIIGVTRDTTGAALGNCVVKLFRTAGDVELATTVSDGSGNFSFIVGGGQYCYVVAYLPGAPDLAGTSVNLLQGV